MFNLVNSIFKNLFIVYIRIKGTDGFFWGFEKFLGEERAICGVTSDLKVIKCAAFTIFMRGATLFRIYPPSGLRMTRNPVQNTNKQHIRGR